MWKNSDSNSIPSSHHGTNKAWDDSVQLNGWTALPCGRRFLQVILSVVQTQVTQRLPAHLKGERAPVDVLWAEGADQNPSAQSGDEDKHSKGTHGSPGQDASSSQEEEVPERKSTTREADLEQCDTGVTSDVTLGNRMEAGFTEHLTKSVITPKSSFCSSEGKNHRRKSQHRFLNNYLKRQILIPALVSPGNLFLMFTIQGGRTPAPNNPVGERSGRFPTRNLFEI